MPKVTADNLVDLLGRSGLVDKPQLAEALAEFERAGGEKSSGGDPLAKFLIERGVITRWQAEKLLEGRHKGFFLRKYKLLDHLGTGGMSSVYLAEHVDMHRRVAIKVLPQSKVSDPAYLTRFYNEARAAGSLSHPNIVQTYDIDSDRLTHYIVMEFVPGHNLQELVKREGVLGYRQAADYIAQAAVALAYAHESGLVHRDVKPANLLVDEKNVVKLLDLGLAFFNVEGQGSLTLASEDNVLGTADYLPPEQAANSHDVDGRADIYSLGCTLYFLLTGHPPFDEGNIGQRIHAHLTQEPPSIFKARPTAPRELVDICARMMAKKPEDRYQSMAAVADALRHYLDESDASDSSIRVRRYGDTPSGMMRRPSLSGDRLRRPGDSTSGSSRLGLGGNERPGGSSVIGRDLGGLKSGSKSGSGPKPLAKEEELELTVLEDDKPHSAPKPSASKPSGASNPGATGTGGASPTHPSKPVDFTSWIASELEHAPRASATEAAQRPAPSDSGAMMLWIMVGVGVAVALVAAVAAIVLMS